MPRKPATPTKSATSTPTKSSTPKKGTPKSTPTKSTKATGQVRVEAVSKRLVPSESKRVSKPVERLQVDSGVKHLAPIVVTKGKGKKLSEIENVAAQMEKRTRSDDLLTTIHRLVLGRVVKKIDVKKNLAEFSGVIYEDDQDKGRKALMAKIEKLRMAEIQQILAFFGQEPKGLKEELVGRLADFFEKPKASDTVYKLASPKKTRSNSTASPIKKSSSNGSSKKKSGESIKRPLSSYMFYCADVREAVKKKNPNETVTGIAKILGKQWKKLSDADKKKYEKQAEKDKERYEKEREKEKEKSGSKKSKK